MRLLEELRSLDPRRPGAWPAPAQAAACVLLALVIQVAAYFALWQGQAEALEQGKVELNRQKQAFLDKKRLAVNLEAYRQQREEIEQAFGALLKQLPNRKEMESLLVDINQAGIGRGLTFELFKPSPSENVTEFYAELPVSLKVTGGYHDLGAFASDLARTPRIVLLTDLKIDSPAKDGPLTMEAVAKTYRYLDEDEVARQRKDAPKKAAKK